MVYYSCALGSNFFKRHVKLNSLPPWQPKDITDKVLIHLAHVTSFYFLTLLGLEHVNF